MTEVAKQWLAAEVAEPRPLCSLAVLIVAATLSEL